MIDTARVVAFGAWMLLGSEARKRRDDRSGAMPPQNGRREEETEGMVE